VYALPKLTFPWAGSTGATFSYDLGGLLIGDELDGQEFLAEVKYYKQVGRQAEMYDEYLAKCYRAYELRPDRCNNFMWITWCPFSISKWQNLLSCDEVFAAVVRHGALALGEPDPTKAPAIVDRSRCDDVAQRLWLIVLSDKQEALVVSREHRRIIQGEQGLRDGS